MREVNPLLTKLLAHKGAKPESGEAVEWEDDLIPDVEDFEESDDELTAILGELSVVDAYNRWANKGTIDPRGRTESIKVRCPNPQHPDNNPSAWINTEKGEGGVGTCAQCGGFDKYQIYAWANGLTPPGGKIGQEFVEVRRRMAEDLGYNLATLGGRPVAMPSPAQAAHDHEPDDETDDDGPDNEPDPPVSNPLLAKLQAHRRGETSQDDEQPADRPTPDAEQPPPAEPSGDESADPTPGEGVVLSIVTGREIKTDDLLPKYSIDWQDLAIEGTFLDEYMLATTELTDIPHEFHLFNGLMALGAVLGRNVYMDEAVPVYPNLMVLLFGDTSTGKSRSLWPMMDLIEEVDPFDPGDEYTHSSGTKIVGSVGSGEALLDAFRHEIIDSSTMQVDEYSGHKGIAKIEEFSMAAAVGRRTGSTFREFLMSMYDSGSAHHSSRTSGSVHVEQAFMQVVSTTQPDAVQEFLHRYDSFSGYLNRWIMVQGENRLGRYLSQLPPPPNMANAAVELRRVRNWATKVHSMRLRGDAYRLWDEFFQEVMVQMKDHGSPLLARWDLNLKKIMLILAANEMLDTPSVEIVERIIRIVFPYMRAIYRNFEEKMAITEEERILDEVTAYVITHAKRHDQWPTVRDLKKSRVGKRYGAKATIDVCEWAAKAGLLVKATSKNAVRYAMVNE